jgi:hypothetical protein
MSSRVVVILAVFMIAGNVGVVVLRRFVRDQGFEVSWLNRSLALERRHLRRLARSRDPVLARRARRYLALAIILSWAPIPFGALFFWAVLR